MGKVSKAKPLPLFFFGAKPVEKNNENPEENQVMSQIEDPEMCSDIMMTSQPLAALFAFYRYYLLQPKYKAIVKFNLDHPAYFKKRDAILELVSDENFRNY